MRVVLIIGISITTQPLEICPNDISVYLYSINEASDHIRKIPNKINDEIITSIFNVVSVIIIR